MTRTTRRAGAVVLCLGLMTMAAGGRQQVPGLTPAAPPPPLDLIPAPAPPVAAKPPTVDELLDRLAGLRAKRAELDAQEKAVVESLRGRLRQQKERLEKLGVMKAEEPVAVPDLVVVPPATR